jgi:alpha/beta superfamily hydrolase
MPLLVTDEAQVVSENVHFAAGAHRLHGQLAYPEIGRVHSAAVIAGPHPLLGGNMDNNVVRHVSAGLAQRGFATCRFNYRGVGRSHGPAADVAQHLAEFWRTGHAPEEMEFRHDLQAAVDFLQEANPRLPMILIGYSFGSALLPSIQRTHGDAPMILIAPTLGKHDYGGFHAISAPLLVISSDDDFATQRQALDDWFAGLTMPLQLVRQRCDNHFFRGHEPWLVETICRFLECNSRA